MVLRVFESLLVLNAGASGCRGKTCGYLGAVWYPLSYVVPIGGSAEGVKMNREFVISIFNEIREKLLRDFASGRITKYDYLQRMYFSYAECVEELSYCDKRGAK